jgi:hypothetical protein
VSEDDVAYLLDLICLCLSVPGLKIQDFLDSGAAEYVVTAPDPFDEAESPQKATERRERNVSVRFAAKDAFEKTIAPSHSAF